MEKKNSRPWMGIPLSRLLAMELTAILITFIAVYLTTDNPYKAIASLIPIAFTCFIFTLAALCRRS
jgi:hypothetical protein